MVPINQVILGGDPLLGSSMVGNSLDEQLQLIEKYKQNLEAAKWTGEKPTHLSNHDFERLQNDYSR